ncbi:MAG TPA: ATP-binding protein [Bacilli bacterium]|nr:ATP-binding protein [Bacilli bacterium]
MSNAVERFREHVMERIQEFTNRWWNDRREEDQNFFYHIDDKFYERVLRAEAEELLTIVFDALEGDAREQMVAWAEACSAKRAVQEVPVDESVERFRMFRRVLMLYFNEFAAAEGLSAGESLEMAEGLNNNCELAMQNYMTAYVKVKDKYFNEQRKRFDMERLASIGQMAAGVAHEVRNPLTTTYGFLQLLKEQQPSYFLDMAMSELQRGIDTISTLLDVAKPNMPQAPKKPVSLANILRQVTELFHDKLYSKELIYELEDEDVMIEGREEMLKQAFFNVLKNALEAMKGTESPRLVLRHRRDGDYLVVEVEDNGGGIPSDKLHLLGTPFFSLKDTGVGLGLTMVYRTMHEHFAQVTVESEAGEGTLFRFIYPLKQQAEATTAG